MDPHGEEAGKKFELAGSKAHYAPSLVFTINHMKLETELDLKSRTVSCSQQMEITAIQDADELSLDAVDLEVKSAAVNGKKTPFRAVGACSSSLRLREQERGVPRGRPGELVPVSLVSRPP